MSVTTGITPETLDFNEIKRWSGEEMKYQMRKSDEMRAKVYEIIKAQSLADIEKAQAQIDTNPTTETIVDDPGFTPDPVVVDTAAQSREDAKQKAIAEENTQLAAAGISVTRDEYGNIAKLIQDYQATDDNGASIGRPTHLEARTWPELSLKQREAHVQAVRWGNRLKQQKISFRETQPQTGQSLSDADLLETMKDLKSDDPQKQLDAIRKVQKNEADKINAEKAEFDRQAAVSRRFLARHKEDFLNCDANIKRIKDYFLENPDLVWTDDNLEICFLAVEHELAPVPQQSAFVAEANTPAQAPVKTDATVSQVAAQAVQPVPATSVQVPVASNTPAAIERPRVNGGVVPGESSAGRPAPAKAKKLTAEEVKSWSPAQMKKNMSDKVMRPLIEEFVRERNQRTQR